MIFVPLIVIGAIGLAILLRPWPLFREAEDSSAKQDAPAYRNVALEFGKWVESQARARGLSVRGVARPVPLECPKCHKTSNYFVYPDELCERCWRATLKPVPTPVNSNRV
jgi:hypothetical protein